VRGYGDQDPWLDEAVADGCGAQVGGEGVDVAGLRVAEAEAVARARDACVDPGVEAGRLRSLRAAWNRAPAVPDCLRVARVGDHPPSISEAGDEDLDETAIRVTRIVEVYRYIKSVGPVREARHVPGRIETGRVPGEADVA